ncbi:hypothetical protein D3C71_1199500 [compost metagenome]
MFPLDHTPRPALTAAAIRALHAQNPAPQVCTLAWEVWRLQRVLIALHAGLRSASTLRHRQDVIDRVGELLEYLDGEPCLIEEGPVRAGARRGGKEQSKR